VAALHPARLRAAGANLPHAVTPLVCRGQGLLCNALYFAMSAALHPTPLGWGSFIPTRMRPQRSERSPGKQAMPEIPRNTFVPVHNMDSWSRSSELQPCC
jgi:hypothetical protein